MGVYIANCEKDVVLVGDPGEILRCALLLIGDLEVAFRVFNRNTKNARTKSLITRRMFLLVGDLRRYCAALFS